MVTISKLICVFEICSLDSTTKGFADLDKETLRGLSEKEIEIEHLRTNVVALNQKLEVRSESTESYMLINSHSLFRLQKTQRKMFRMPSKLLKVQSRRELSCKCSSSRQVSKSRMMHRKTRHSKIRSLMRTKSLRKRFSNLRGIQYKRRRRSST